MEEEKKLYPLRLIPTSESPCETVHLADLGFPDTQVRNGWLATNAISEIMEMYMDRVVGEGLFSVYGRQFPVMIKRIHASARTPLLVHPDDEIAAERYDFLGKAKMWYVISAKPGSKLYLGFKRDLNASELYSACKAGTVEEMLNVVEPLPGDSFLIRPGTVHAVGEGVEIVEVAESSPLDFRLFNWGRREELDPFDAELNLEAAIDFIDYRAYEAHPCMNVAREGARMLCDEREFTVSELRLKAPVSLTSEVAERFVAYICLSGEAAVKVADDEQPDAEYAIRAEEALLIPAEVSDFQVFPKAQDTLLIEVYMRVPETVVAYVDPTLADEAQASAEEDADWNDYGSMESGMVGVPAYSQAGKILN